MLPSANSIEKQRRLQSLPITGAGPITRDIPKDTVIKRIQLRLRGGITYTYTGTPVSRADSIFHSLVNSIQVVANGSRFIKNVQPHLMRMQQLFNTGAQAERGSSAAAAEVPLPTTSQGFVFGTSGQTTTVAESISIPFEFIWAIDQAERALTWLDTRNLSSCELRLIQNPLTSLKSEANAAVLTFGANTLAVDITLVEAVGLKADRTFMDFRQSTRDVPFTAQTNNFQVEINRGASLAGLWFYAKDGAQGGATVAADRLASNTLVSDLVLKMNGSVDLKATTFLELQAENRARYGLNAPYAGNVSPIDGVAHMNFINRTINDAVVTSKGVDSLFLFVSTNAAPITSYFFPAILTIQTDEIAPISQ